MKITQVKLENFKVYDNQVFTFTKGANAICGPNGSGKTTILEAISWALFDYLPYKNQENVVKMTKSKSDQSTLTNKVAKVQVNFISDLDKLEYTVCRTTRGHYYIVNNFTNERIAENKKEVIPFLKKHYNLSLTTNLEEIFINTIGVPQGMLTAIFHSSPTNRKKIFDKVLNIEDYRLAYEKLKDFKMYLNNQVNDIKVKIAVYSSDLDKLSQLETDFKATIEQITLLNDEINLLKKTISKISFELDILSSNEKQIQELSNSLDKQKNLLDNLNKRSLESRKQLNESENALNELNLLKPNYDNYLIQKQILETFAHKKNTHDELSKNIAKEELELQNIIYKLEKNNEKINNIRQIKNEINGLEDLLLKQNKLEEEKLNLEIQKENLNKLQTNINFLKEDLKDLYNKLESKELDLAVINELKEMADSYELLNINYQNSINSLKETEKSLLDTEKIAKQVHGGLCPFLKEKCKNLSDGQNLDQYFNDKIQIFKNDSIQKQKILDDLEKPLKESYEAFDKYKTHSIIENEKNNIISIIDSKTCELNKLEVKTKELISIPDQYKEITEKLTMLGSPKDKIDILKRQICEENSIINCINFDLKNKSSVISKIKSLKEELINLNYDEAEYTDNKNIIMQLEKDYQQYLRLETSASKFEYFNQQLKTIMEEKEGLTKQLDFINTELNKYLKIYDHNLHMNTKLNYENLKIKLIRLEENLSTEVKTKEKYEQILSNLKEIANKSEIEQKNIDQYNKITEFLDVSRDILKDCAANIGKYYIESISLEANSIYHEITGQNNQELSWETDYEITITEDEKQRSYANLSGGEQMSAALAIRLALLKELSDINIAFFDEPTTNMDETRRFNLAQQIKNIKNFEQLFVISHDDTFEKDTDHAIRL